ncbi:MAG: hypothetical protein WDW36_000208 [Sanguina aurantia]
MAEVEFGFVPHHVVVDLQDIGNWKSRAAAIDTLQRTLQDVLDKSQILAGLPLFTAFLVTLVADPNFKIALSSMQIMDLLACKVGSDIEPQLRHIVPALLEKFTDSKVLVRKEAVKVLRRLMAASSPKRVFDLAALGVGHASWRVREEVLNLGIMAMLQHDRTALDPGRLFKTVLAGLSDPKERVRLVALEAMAVLSRLLGAYDFGALCTRFTTGDDVRAAVAGRCAGNPALPSVSPDGLIEHVVEFPPLDRMGGVALGGVAFGGVAFGGAALAGGGGGVMGGGGEGGLGGLWSLRAGGEELSKTRPSSLLAGGAKLPWEMPPSNPRPRMRSLPPPDPPTPSPSAAASPLDRPALQNVNQGASLKALSADPDSLWSPSLADSGPGGGRSGPGGGGSRSGGAGAYCGSLAGPHSPALERAGLNDLPSRTSSRSSSSSSTDLCSLVPLPAMSSSQNGDSRSLHPSEQRKSPRNSHTGPSLGNPSPAPAHAQSAGTRQSYLSQQTRAGSPLGVGLPQRSPHDSMESESPAMTPRQSSGMHRAGPVGSSQSADSSAFDSSRSKQPHLQLLQQQLVPGNPLGSSSGNSDSRSAHTQAHHVPPGGGYGGGGGGYGGGGSGGSPFSTGVFNANGSGESLRPGSGSHPPTSSDNPGLAMWLHANLEPDHPGCVWVIVSLELPHESPSLQRPSQPAVCGPSHHRALDASPSPTPGLASVPSTHRRTGCVAPTQAAVNTHIRVVDSPHLAESQPQHPNDVTLLGTGSRTDASRSGDIAESQANQRRMTYGPTRKLRISCPDRQATPHRQETFSPSKVELLANLKRRQLDKRANSAQLPVRPGSSSLGGGSLPSGAGAAALSGELAQAQSWTSGGAGAGGRRLAKDVQGSGGGGRAASGLCEPTWLAHACRPLEAEFSVGQPARATLYREEGDPSLWGGGEERHRAVVLRACFSRVNRREPTAGAPLPQQRSSNAALGPTPCSTLHGAGQPRRNLFSDSQIMSPTPRAPQVSVFDAYSVQPSRSLPPPPSPRAPTPPPAFNEDTPCRGDVPRVTSGRRGSRVGGAEGQSPFQQQPMPPTQQQQQQQQQTQTLNPTSRQLSGSGATGGSSGSRGLLPLPGMQQPSWATNAPPAAYGSHVPQQQQQQQQQQALYGYSGGGVSNGGGGGANPGSGNSGPRGSAVPAARTGHLAAAPAAEAWGVAAGASGGGGSKQSLGSVGSCDGASGASSEKSTRLDELTTAELSPLLEPERMIRSVISKMIEANNADRKELDWQGQFAALTDARRLMRHHPDVIRGALHEFVRAVVPSIEQLRSFTVKNTLLLFQEMFQSLGKGLDKELDEIVPALLKKAGEVSQAGRENFMSAEADKCLTEMTRSVSEARAVAALASCANHKSMHVRAKVASHLDELLEVSGHSLVASWTPLERLFKTAAGFLDEGALETRTYGKRLIWNAKAAVGNRQDFDRLLGSLSSEPLIKRVLEVVESMNGPPPPPSKTGGGPAPRVNSRQLGSVGSTPNSPFSQPSPASSSSAANHNTANNNSGGGGSYGENSTTGGGGYGNGGGGGGSFLERQASSGGNGNGSSGAGGSGGVRGAAASHSHSAPNGSSGFVGGGSSGGGGSAPSYGGGGGSRLLSGGGTPLRQRGGGVPPRGSRPGAEGEEGGSSGVGQRGGSGRERNGGGSSSGGSEVSAAALDSCARSVASMGAKDFRERSDALKAVEALLPHLCGAQDSVLVSLMDALTARLADGNSKVSTLALEVLATLFCTLRERSSAGLNTVIPALVSCLGSANDKIRAVATAAVDSLIASVDPALLVQNFSHCVSNGHLRGKPQLVEKLQAIIVAAYPSKPQLVARYAVPAALSLLGDSRGDTRAASTALLTTLARLMGPPLLDHSGNLSPQQQQRVSDAVAACQGGRGA